MSKFLKLTNIIFKTSDIHKILIQTNKYVIHVEGKKMDGFTLMIYGSGIGNFTSSSSIIEVCKTNDPTDYEIVSEWISRN